MKAWSKSAVVAAGLGYMLLTAALFLSSPWIRPVPSTGVFLAVFSAAVLWACTRLKVYGWLRGRSLVALLAVALYSSFASFGYRLFLSGERMQFSAGRIGVFLLGTAWFVPVLLALLGTLERTCTHMAVRQELSGRALRRAFGWLWAVAMACQAVVVASFWPGGFPLDAILQLYQALGLEPLNDWHPVMHTLLHRFFLLFFDHPGYLVAVQGFFFSLIVARAALTACRFGARLRTVALGVAVFCLLPNQVLSNIALLKDFPFTYALVWGTLLLAELAQSPDRLRRPGFIIQMVLCMFLVGGLRHNGILPMLFMAMALVAVGVRHRRLICRAAACALVPMLLLAGLKGPIYRLLKVEPNTVPSYVTMLCAAGACLHQGETLSEASEEKLETILSLEDWASGYSRFAGHDLYRDLEPSFMERTRLSLTEVFSVYLEALAKYPDIVIKDRLDGMNLLWDVTQPDESFNTDYSDHAFIESDVGLVVPGAQEGEAYRNPSLIARTYRWINSFHFPGEPLTGQLHNMLLWRSGAWLILLCVLMLYWLRRRLSGLWLCAAPLLGNLLAMVLALCHQSFRYVYFVQPLTLCLVLITVLFDARRRKIACTHT
ncbi:MAG: DUF6020 family protein [Clostridiales bacterium]|nr:DUF6020 family protein [Clostridiales bacterium]